MASTNKTPQLGLNQWAAGDPVLREDFNADNVKIEAMVDRGTCVMKQYVGDGKVNRDFNLGFKPRFVILIGRAENANGIAYIMGSVNWISFTGNFSEMDAKKVALTETGFRIMNVASFNVLNGHAAYIAFY